MTALSPYPGLSPRRERRSLVDALAGLSNADGFSPSRLPGVQIMRATRTFPYVAVSYEASIVIIAQGQKKGRLDRQDFTFNAQNYLILSIPLPFECATIGSLSKPMLGLAIRVDPAIVAELLLAADGAVVGINGLPRAIGTAPVTPEIYDAAVRLAECLHLPTESRILGPPIVREIIYRALCGSQGAALRGLVSPKSGLGQIARILNRMHLQYARPLVVAELAKEAGMSISNFHASFKAVTGYPPQRYLQTLRQHKAQVLLAGGGSVAEVAREVGYESPSQFSREYKRLFGRTPRETTKGWQDLTLSQ